MNTTGTESYEALLYLLNQPDEIIDQFLDLDCPAPPQWGTPGVMALRRALCDVLAVTPPCPLLAPADRGTPQGERAYEDFKSSIAAAAVAVTLGHSAEASAAAAATVLAERHSSQLVARRMDRWFRSTQRPDTAPARTNTRPRAARRSPRRGTVKTAQDPGSDDGGDDSDPDPDPVGEAIERLLDSAPPFSVGQQALLARILSGAR